MNTLPYCSTATGAFLAQPKERRMIAYVMLWTTTSAASIFIVIWCEKMIAKNFSQLGDVSHATKRMHSEFQRALLAMAICPLFTTSIPVFYFMTTIAFQLCPWRVSAIMTICLSSISLFNPLTTIICFRCYRRAAARFLTFGRYNKDSVKSLTNVTAATSEYMPLLVNLCYFIFCETVGIEG
ncbi:serpentine type 7TM GPCR chemoreceptor srh domain-containing protein [Ditylenchus destructor]|uniref:Serpentine type 7TM GPCR chemoreceptor srh domain-containing protein n=1 Tax=Ditylenchus destructor TaxID=166010 RepID=A0AAD4MYS5_9BILA|nr:serpentine type 7TM GPCR chemoreceptor srh domain-containing protein [Ditylenchus destructor]